MDTSPTSTPKYVGSRLHRIPDTMAEKIIAETKRRVAEKRAPAEPPDAESDRRTPPRHDPGMEPMR